MKGDKINITEVHFTRKFNLGNYETIDIGFVATVAENQNHIDVVKALDQETIKYRKAREVE
jgi:hypothetical protein